MDVRVIGSTNADIGGMVDDGEFRADLLDRLSFDVVHVPPLRCRQEDVLELAQHFAWRMSHELGWVSFAGFSEAAEQQLMNHAWPGNVRELRNVIERSLARCDAADAEVDAIYFDVLASPYADSQLQASDSDNDVPVDLSLPFKQQVMGFEKQLLEAALQANHYHQSHTAQDLGLSYHQLRGLLKKHHLVGGDDD